MLKYMDFYRDIPRRDDLKFVRSCALRTQDTALRKHVSKLYKFSERVKQGERIKVAPKRGDADGVEGIAVCPKWLLAA